jgi:catechol 2,3-dioxygenase-like lactoylglutathione lyase family enzyme
LILGIDHLAIAAKDPQSLAEWYVKYLDMEILAHNGQSPPTLLVGGRHGALLEIMPANGNPVVIHEWADSGIRHIALRVDNLDQIQARLEAVGIESVRPGGAAMGGGALWNFADPEGNVFQIVQRPESFRKV